MSTLQITMAYFVIIKHNISILAKIKNILDFID